MSVERRMRVEACAVLGVAEPDHSLQGQEAAMITKPTLPRDPQVCPGEWRRPGPADLRSPCPALNALANAGHLPRGGKVTLAQLVDALKERLGLPRILGVPLSKRVMARLGKVGSDGVTTLDLSALALHGFLEHDASLTRRDARDGDASAIVPPLVEQLLAMSEDGRTLTLEDLAAAHQLRMTQSAAGGHEVPLEAGVLGTIEAALLYKLLLRDGSVALADVRELVETERLPASAVPGKLGLGSLLATTVTLALMGNVPGSRASKRARDAASEGLASAAPPRAPVTQARGTTRGGNGVHDASAAIRDPKEAP